jgi:hypothetical protein
LIPNSQSKKLLAEKNIGKKVELTGKKFADAKYIDVESIKLIAGEKNVAAVDSTKKPMQQPKPEKSTKPNKVIYTCPMHSEVTSDKPGDCPKCGMKLIKKQS